METRNHEDTVVYEMRKPSERLVRWSCAWPVSLVNAVKRYSAESGIPQTTIVKRATEKALRDLGLL